MKKTAYIIGILALVALFAPVQKVDAANYGAPDAFTFYQYPIPWYTYFETPNATARNYYPTNYSNGYNTAPRYYSPQPVVYNTPTCGYSSCGGNGYTGGYSAYPTYNSGYGNGYGSNGYNGYNQYPQQTAGPRYTTSNYSSNPGFTFSGTAPVTFSYISDQGNR